MEFARTHKRLMFALLLIDVAALISFQWVPFDGFPKGTNLAMKIAGIMSLSINMAGYFFAILVGAGDSFLAYVVMFLIAYVEMVLLALGINKCWMAIRPISAR